MRKKNIRTMSWRMIITPCSLNLDLSRHNSYGDGERTAGRDVPCRTCNNQAVHVTLRQG